MPNPNVHFRYLLVTVGMFCLLAATATPLALAADAPIPNPGARPIIRNPLDVNNIPDLLDRVITGLLGFVGLLTLLALIWGAGGIIMAFGDEEKIKESKKIIMGAIIGLLVVMLAYAILRTIYFLF